MSIPVIVDCDPGHDDALALWFAAGHPSLDLLAVTTVGGNVPLEHTSRNARIVLSVAGVTDVPVAAGAEGPLVARRSRRPSGSTARTASAGRCCPSRRCRSTRAPRPSSWPTCSLAADEPVAIIATGPITNVAVLLRDRPELADRIREIVWMGGSTERGNATPYAEFNALVDPEALDLVVRSGVKFTMVGLNVTHRALVTPDVRARLAAIGNRTSAFGDELLEFFCRTNAEVFGMPDGPLHDPVAVAVLADPGCVELSCTRASTSSSRAPRRSAPRASTSTACCAASRTRGSRRASTSTGSGPPSRHPSLVSPESRAPRAPLELGLDRRCRHQFVHAGEDLVGPERVLLDLGLVADAGEHEDRVQAGLDARDDVGVHAVADHRRCSRSARRSC